MSCQRRSLRVCQKLRWQARLLQIHVVRKICIRRWTVGARLACEGAREIAKSFAGKPSAYKDRIIQSARHHRLAGRLLAFALGRVGTLLGGLLVAGKRGGLGLFALVPGIAAVAATGWQAGVLGEDLGGGVLRHLVAAGRRRVL